MGWEEEENPRFNRGANYIFVGNNSEFGKKQKENLKKAQKLNNSFSILRKVVRFSYNEVRSTSHCHTLKGLMIR